MADVFVVLFSNHDIKNVACC